MFWPWCVWAIDCLGPCWLEEVLMTLYVEQQGEGWSCKCPALDLNLCFPFKETSGAATGFNSWCELGMVFLAAFSLSRLHSFSPSCYPHYRHRTLIMAQCITCGGGNGVVQMSCWYDGQSDPECPFISTLERLCQSVLIHAGCSLAKALHWLICAHHFLY